MVELGTHRSCRKGLRPNVWKWIIGFADAVREGIRGRGVAFDRFGLDPEDLGGSPWEAAITSFLLFTVGAIIPITPFIFLSGSSLSQSL